MPQSNHNLNVGSLDQGVKLVTKTALGEKMTFTREYLIKAVFHKNAKQTPLGKGFWDRKKK